DAPERPVGCDFPAHLDVGPRHAAISIEWLRREPRPQHDTIGPRIARGHPQREGIGGKRHLCENRIRETRQHDSRSPDLPGDVEQLAPRELRKGAAVMTHGTNGHARLLSRRPALPPQGLKTIANAYDGPDTPAQ